MPQHQPTIEYEFICPAIMADQMKWNEKMK